MQDSATPIGIRAQWAVASPKYKMMCVAAIALTLAIIVFAIIPMIGSIFHAGRSAVQ